MAGATRNCSRLGASPVYTIQPCSMLHAPCHFMQSHIRKVYACLAVTCHLHFWQNDRDLLRATVVTRGWNGYRNKSQHRKSTLEKKILPPFQQGFEPATFQSQVRRSNHWAIPAPRAYVYDCCLFSTLHCVYDCCLFSTLHCVYDCCLFSTLHNVYDCCLFSTLHCVYDCCLFSTLHCVYDRCLFRLWLEVQSVLYTVCLIAFCSGYDWKCGQHWLCCVCDCRLFRLWLLFVEIMTGVCSDYDWCLFRLWLVFVQIITVFGLFLFSSFFLQIMTGGFVCFLDYDWCLFRLWLVFVQIMTGVCSDYDMKLGEILHTVYVIVIAVCWDFDWCLMRLWPVFVEIMTGVFSDYDWKSGKYSTWTESRWDLFKVRVFLIPSKRAEVRTHFFGLLHGNSALHCIHSVSFVSHSECLSLSHSLCLSLSLWHPPTLSLSLSLSRSHSCLSDVDWIHLLFWVYFLCCVCLMYSYVWFVCKLVWRR